MMGYAYNWEKKEGGGVKTRKTGRGWGTRGGDKGGGWRQKFKVYGLIKTSPWVSAKNPIGIVTIYPRGECSIGIRGITINIEPMVVRMRI
jgi:hypothetical protein